MSQNRRPSIRPGAALRVGALLLVAAVALVGCNRGGGESDEEAAVGSTPTSVATSVATTVSTTAQGDTTTTEPPAPLAYEIRQRIPGDEGDVLVVLVEPGVYTDVQLENLIGDIVEEHGPLAELHVIDDLAALPALLKAPEERTPDEEALLEQHYLVKVEEGSLVTFMGPYAEYGTTVIGS